MPVLALLLVTGSAVAAEEEKTATDTVQLKTVKVTANKMEEDPMDVPQSLTVIGEIELQEKGMTSIADVVADVPGMSYSQSYGMAINFRGLNHSMFTGTNPVTLYVDGIGHSGSSGFDASLMNVERVEVLRGPSSTLYGKNAMGAVINVITKDPTNTWEGKIGTEVGNLESITGYASANGPLIDDLLYLGFSAHLQKDQGWIDNEYPGTNEDADYIKGMRLNGYLLYKPTDDLRVRFSVHHSHEDGGKAHECNMGAGATLDDFDADECSTVSEDVDTHVTNYDDSQSLHVEYSFDAAKLDSITTHKFFETEGVYDGDLSDTVANLGLEMFGDSEARTIGQEFRLSSLNETGFRWLTGIYGDMTREKNGPYGGEYIWGVPTADDARSTQDSYTLAAFGQVMIPFGDFELTAGGRLQQISKTIDLTFYQGPIGALVPIYSMEGTKKWNTFLPKAALTYDFTDHWTTYVSYSHGYMPGGFNFYAYSGTLEDNSFKPVETKNYEIGLKAGYDNFTMGATAFYMDIENIHVYKVAGSQWLTDNAKKAHSYGLELEGAYKPIDTLELSGSVTLTRAKYDDYFDGTNQYKGENIENTPEYAIRLGAAYHAPSGLYARADGRYVGPRSFFDDAHDMFSKADPYTIIDTKLGYRFDNNFDVYGYVDNVFGQQYVTLFRSSGSKAKVGLSAPRTFGVGVIYTF